MVRKSPKVAVSLLTVLLIVTACVIQKSPVTGNRRAYGYSWAQEVKIGAQADQQIVQQYGVYNNESIQNYVDQVAQSVLKTSDMRGPDVATKYDTTSFTFRVLDSPVVNAFALPGGYVYLTRGLLSHLRNEAQLAVVIGHEIGHVAARHASQRAFEQQMGQLALIGGAVAGQELLGIPGGQILNLGSQAAQLLFLKYSRDDERESDRLGVEYAAKQNYEASEGAAFFRTLQRLSQRSGQSLPTWASTHPDPSNRAERIPELAQNWKEKGYELTVKDTDQYMRELENMIYGVNPRHGFTRNGMFYHPELAFKFPYPENWQLINTPSMVQIVNPDQNAIIVFQIDGKNSTPRASVAEFLNQQGITTTGTSQTSQNGLNGFEATASAQTQDGANVRFYLYAVEYNGDIYRYVTYTLAEQFSNYRSVFVQTAKGFDDLNDASILNIQPARLNNYRVDRTAPFRSFLPDELPMDITPQEVAIANQVELDETIEAGTWIKVPRQ